MEMSMKVRSASEIMDRSELTLTPDLDIGTAMRRMLRAKLTGAPVIDSTERLCGMLRERDCLTAIVRQAVDGGPGGTVGDYMSAAVESVTPETQLLDITYLFLERPFRKIPVVRANNRVVGQVSRPAILRAIDSTKDNPFLYGTTARSPHGVEGVHSAMERARGKS